MKVLGIDFVPFNEPLKNRLEALSAGMIFFLVLGLLPIGSMVTVYVLFFTKYRLLLCVYLFWIWVVDREIPENGSRTSQWLRSWTLFTYAKNYFPVTLKAVPGFKVDPEINYLACSFPHGFMPFGTMETFLTNAFEETKMVFPKHLVNGITLGSNFYIPLYREFLLALGMCSSSAKSINWLLGHPGGGRVAGITIGGSAEACYCHQKGNYRLVLKNRKGFVKLALKNGSPIIPTFSFGQNRNFKQLVFAEGSVFRRCQDTVKNITGISLLFVYGRGLFNYTFGFIPLQFPINVVLGAPISVNKIDQPTSEDIDSMHSIFIEKLTELFERYKYEYEEDPENCSLTIC